MKTLPTLTFTHRFTTGLAVTLHIERAEFRLPKVRIETERPIARREREEYLKWRAQVVAQMMTQLTPGEVLRCAANGIRVTA